MQAPASRHRKGKQKDVRRFIHTYIHTYRCKRQLAGIEKEKKLKLTDSALTHPRDSENSHHLPDLYTQAWLGTAKTDHVSSKSDRWGMMRDSEPEIFRDIIAAKSNNLGSRHGARTDVLKTKTNELNIMGFGEQPHKASHLYMHAHDKENCNAHPDVFTAKYMASKESATTLLQANVQKINGAHIQRPVTVSGETAGLGGRCSSRHSESESESHYSNKSVHDKTNQGRNMDLQAFDNRNHTAHIRNQTSDSSTQHYQIDGTCYAYNNKNNSNQLTTVQWRCLSLSDFEYQKKYMGGVIMDLLREMNALRECVNVWEQTEKRDMMHATVGRSVSGRRCAVCMCV
jgi:hypothetical protein